MDQPATEENINICEERMSCKTLAMHFFYFLFFFICSATLGYSNSAYWL